MPFKWFAGIVGFAALIGFAQLGGPVQVGDAQEAPPAQSPDELPPPAPGAEPREAPPPPRTPADSVRRPPALTPPALTPPDESAPDESSPDELAPPAEARPGDRPGYLGLIGDVDVGGVRVLSVPEGGPAAQAGFRENDVISQVDGRPVKTLDDMTTAIDSHRAGDEVTFAITRGERAMEIRVTLGERAELGPVPNESLPTPGAAPAATGRPKLGIHVATVTDELRARYGIALRSGAMITAVQGGSPADQAGVPAGAVITAIDGQPVDREHDVISYIASARVGQEVEIAYEYNGAATRKQVRLAAAEALAAPAPLAAGEAPGEVRESRPLRRRLLLPGGVVAEGPALDRIERMIDAFAGPLLEERVVVGRAPAAEATAPAADVESLRDEVEQLKRRITELEDELAAERAETP